MLTIACATFALAACQKENVTEVQDQVINKSVVLDIANVLMTKSEGTTIANNTPVQLNSFQVFFADKNGTFYTPKDQTAVTLTDTYYKNGDTDYATTKQFHFLPKDVVEVIVVGNMNQLTATNRTQLETLVKEVKLADEQTPTALRLYGIDSQLARMDEDAEDYEHETGTEDTHPEPLYKAEIELVPTVARFEISKFEYAAETKEVTDEEGNKTTVEVERQYKTMVVDNISIIDFDTEATVTFAGVVTSKTPYQYFQGSESFPTLNDDNVYPNYLNLISTAYKNAEDKTGWWYYDEPNASLAEGAYAWNEKLYAYHTFPAKVPTFVVGLTATDENGIVSKLYLTTKTLNVKDGETTKPLTATEAADIYKMEFVFTDANLRSAEKCIEVVITVDTWKEKIVVPDFGGNTL